MSHCEYLIKILDLVLPRIDSLDDPLAGDCMLLEQYLVYSAFDKRMFVRGHYYLVASEGGYWCVMICLVEMALF